MIEKSNSFNQKPSRKSKSESESLSSLSYSNGMILKGPRGRYFHGITIIVKLTPFRNEKRKKRTR